MSDLDIKYKAKLLVCKDFNKKFKIPILYITHSIEEISQIGDQIVLIKMVRKSIVEVFQIFLIVHLLI